MNTPHRRGLREINCQNLYTFNQVRSIICPHFGIVRLLRVSVLRKWCHWSCEHQPVSQNVRIRASPRIYSAKTHNSEWRCGPGSGTLFVPSFWSFWVTGHFFCTVRLSNSISMGPPSNVIPGILLKAAWIDGQCVIVQTDSKLLAITFIYSMVFDFVVLALTAFKLLYPVSGRSKLVELIFNDGLIYFAIA